MGEWIEREYADLSGGVNTQSALSAMADNEFRVCENLHTDITGSVSIRNGYTHLDTVPDSATPQATGVFQYIPVSGANEVLKTCRNTAATLFLFRRSDGAGGWVTVAQTGFSLANHNFVTSVRANFKLYLFANGGTNRVMVYNGTDLREVAGSPKAYGAEYFYDRVFAWGDPVQKDRLYFSATGDPENFTTSDSGYIDVAIGDGDGITGIGKLFNRLVIFKRSSIFVLEGNDFSSFTVQPVISDSGCIAARSIVNIENLIYYLSEKGVYTTDGNVVKYVGHNVKTIRQAMPRQYDFLAWAFHHRRRGLYILCVVASGTIPNQALAYKYRSTTDESQLGQSSGWTVYTSFSFSAGVITKGPNSDDFIYFVGNNGFSYFFERLQNGTYITNDDGAEIIITARTKWFDHGDLKTTKFVRRVIPVFGTTGPGIASVRDVNIGIPTCRVYQLVFSGGVTSGLTLSLYTDFDEATMQQSVAMTLPAGTTFSRLEKYLVLAQDAGDRGVMMN